MINKNIYILIYLILLFSISNSKEIHPSGQLKASGNVVDMVCKNGLVVAGTDAGAIDIFLLKNKKKISTLNIPAITDFYGDEIQPKIFSVDFIDKKGSRILAVCEAIGGNRRLLMLDRKNNIEEIVPASSSLFIRKARFVDNEKILIALMSSEIILKNILKKSDIYSAQISQSTFSDFDLNFDNTQFALSSESGEIEIVDVLTGKILQTLKGGNLDNVYKISFSKNRIITAGQDRKAAIYNIRSGNFDSYESQFLVYAAAINKSETYAVFAFNEQGHMAIVDIVAKKIIHTLLGHKSMLNTILFIDEKNLVSSSDDPNIKLWSLP